MLQFIVKAWQFLSGKFKYFIMALAAAGMVAACAAAGIQSNRLKEYKEKTEQLQKTIDEQNELIRKLAGMESVHCEVSLTVKNTAVMGATHTGNLELESKQLAVYLRGEILEAIEEAENKTKGK